MYATQLVAHLLAIKSGRRDYKIFDEAIDELYKLEKIRQIVTRGLKAQDPINLYKANCLNQIAEILEIKVEPESPVSDQMTIDDII